MTGNITQVLADYACGTRAENLPEPIRDLGAKIIFDELAGAAFSRRAVGASIMARYAAQQGGRGEARILGTAYLATAAHAALANGTAGHGEEVDGTHVVGGHPGATVVHAAAAMAERQRERGADYLNAVVLGYDIATRAVAACGGLFSVRDRFHLNSDFLFAIGGAAAVGRLMGLSPERHCHAYALATFQINGLCALFAEERHISKSFYSGQYAYAAVSSALLAAEGMEGNPDIFGAKHGVLEAWGAEGGREILTAGLGTEFSVRQANFKFLNAGYPIHAPVEAVTRLRREDGVALNRIESITIGMPENAMRVVSNRDMPEICVEDMVVATTVQGGLALSDTPFPAMLANAEFQRLRPVTRAEPDAQLQRENPNGRGARVTFHLKGGSARSAFVPHPRGHSQRGEVTWEELHEKWRDNFVGPSCARALEMSQRLHEVEDVGTYIAAFCP